MAAPDSLTADTPRGERGQSTSPPATPTGQSPFSGRSWMWILPLAAMAFGLASARRIDDFDGWWHLANGRIMLEQHRIPMADEFSHTKRGVVRVPHEWLSEASLYASFRVAGYPGVMVWRGLIVGLTFALCGYLVVLRGLRSAPLALVILLLGAGISIPEWLERPKILAPLFFVATLTMLELADRGRKWPLYSVPLLIVLWANCHASFVAGIGLIALKMVCRFAEEVGAAGEGVGAPEGRWCPTEVGPPTQPPTRPHGGPASAGQRWPGGATVCLRARALAPFVLAAALAPLLTPGGLHTIANPFSYSGGSSSWHLDTLQEWLSPNFHRPPGRILEVGLICIILSLALSRRRPNAFDLLVILGTVHLSLHSIRHVALLGGAGLAITVLYADSAFGALSEWRGVTNLRTPLAGLRERAADLPRGALASAAATFALAVAVLAIPRDGAFEQCVATENLPVAALEAALATPHTGNLFNQYEWGGYIAYASGGRLPVFIDGRADLYGEKLYREYDEAIEGRSGWREVFAKYDIGLAIIPLGAPLTMDLERDPTFRRAYADPSAVVFVRSDAGVTDLAR